MFTLRLPWTHHYATLFLLISLYWHLCYRDMMKMSCATHVSTKDVAALSGFKSLPYKSSEMCDEFL